MQYVYIYRIYESPFALGLYHTQKQIQYVYIRWNLQILLSNWIISYTQKKHFSLTWTKIEGSRPEWCISSMIYSTDTPFWSGTLQMQLKSGFDFCTCFSSQCMPRCAESAGHMGIIPGWLASSQHDQCLYSHPLSPTMLLYVHMRLHTSSCNINE